MEEYGVFLISLSYTEEGQLRGRLKTLSDEEDYEFGDLAEAVLKIEELLDRQMGPRSSPLRQFDETGGIKRGAYLPASKEKGRRTSSVSGSITVSTRAGRERSDGRTGNRGCTFTVCWNC